MAFCIVFLVLVFVGLVIILALAEDKVKSVQLTPATSADLRLVSKRWWPAEVGFRDTSLELSFTETQLSVSSNIEIDLVNPPTGWKLQKIGNEGGRYYYVILVTNVPTRVTEYVIKFLDSRGNLIYREVIINPQGALVALPSWADSKYLSSGDDLLVQVNREFKLPQDYVPQDLLILSDLGIRTWFPTQLRQEAALELQKMTQAIQAAGLDYLITSGYRSFADQLRIYNEKVSAFGSTDVADRISSRPGYSEHQLGTTIDIVTSENGYSTGAFELTRLSNWLKEHAHEYGFVMSYNSQSGEASGFIYEPWHYRYIGGASAAEFIKSGLTLDAWLKGLR